MLQYDLLLGDYRKYMILRVACLPLPGERHNSVGVVLEALEHVDILVDIGNRRGVHLLDTMRVLEHERGGERETLEMWGFNVLVETRAPRAPKLAPSLLDERSRALSGQVNARCLRPRRTGTLGPSTRHNSSLHLYLLSLLPLPK